MAYPANTHGALPTLTTTVGKYDYLALVTDDGGSTWTLFVGGLNN